MPKPHRPYSIDRLGIGLLLITSLISACSRVPIVAATATQAPPVASPTRVVVDTPVPAASATSAPAATPTAGVRTATITDLVPGVLTRSNQSAAFMKAALGQTLLAGSSVRTDTTGGVTLNFPEGSIIRVGSDTDLEIQDLGGTDDSPTGYFRMALGKIFIRLQAALGQGDFVVETPAGVASVRGSFIGIMYRPETDSTDIVCLETSGTCTVQVGNQVVMLRTGERTTATYNKIVLPRERICPEDLDEFWEEIQVIEAKLPPDVAQVLVTVFPPNGLPAACATRTPLPTVTPLGGAPPTATSTATRLPVLLPTFTPTATPTRTSTPTPTKTCAPSTIPCAP